MMNDKFFCLHLPFIAPYFASIHSTFFIVSWGPWETVDSLLHFEPSCIH